MPSVYRHRVRKNSDVLMRKTVADKLKRLTKLGKCKGVGSLASVICQLPIYQDGRDYSLGDHKSNLQDCPFQIDMNMTLSNEPSNASMDDGLMVDSLDSLYFDASQNRNFNLPIPPQLLHVAQVDQPCKESNSSDSPGNKLITFPNTVSSFYGNQFDDGEDYNPYMTEYMHQYTAKCLDINKKIMSDEINERVIDNSCFSNVISKPHVGRCGQREDSLNTNKCSCHTYETFAQEPICSCQLVKSCVTSAVTKRASSSNRCRYNQCHKTHASKQMPVAWEVHCRCHTQVRASKRPRVECMSHDNGASISKRGKEEPPSYNRNDTRTNMTCACKNTQHGPMDTVHCESDTRVNNVSSHQTYAMSESEEDGCQKCNNPYSKCSCKDVDVLYTKDCSCQETISPGAKTHITTSKREQSGCEVSIQTEINMTDIDTIVKQKQQKKTQPGIKRPPRHKPSNAKCFCDDCTDTIPCACCINK